VQAEETISIKNILLFKNSRFYVLLQIYILEIQEDKLKE
jgi:hypothetical protein